MMMITKIVVEAGRVRWGGVTAGRCYRYSKPSLLGTRIQQQQQQGRGLKFAAAYEGGKKEFVMTKMVCTVGPATMPPMNPEGIQGLVEEGMTVMRFNFSHIHDDYSEVEKAFKALRAAQGVHSTLRGLDDKAVARVNNVRAALLDLKGPEVRTGVLADGKKSIDLVAGAEILITTDPAFAKLCTSETLYMDYKSLASTVNAGSQILLDDGGLGLEVLSVSLSPEGHSQVVCRVGNSAPLGSRKGVNLPGARLDLPAITDKDRKDIEWGVKLGFDFIAASFVRKAGDVRTIIALLERICERESKARGLEEGKELSRPLVISKIENSEGVDNFDEILDASDGIMVARGDLGMEVPFQKLLILQKKLVRKCNLAGKPVIVATQMLDSMINRPRPTRAEVTDVGNAILEGTDAVMLSGETANGKYPIKAAQAMISIAREADDELDHSRLGKGSLAHQTLKKMLSDDATKDSDVIAASAVQLAEQVDADLIIVLTRTGAQARKVAKFRPSVAVMAFCSNVQTARSLVLHRALFPIVMESVANVEETDRINESLRTAKEIGWVKAGDKIVLVDAEVLVRARGVYKTRAIKLFKVPE